MTTVDCWFTDVELADPDRFVGSLSAEFGAVCGLPCGASALGAAAVAAGVTGVAASRATGDGIGFAEGVGAAVCSVGCWVGNVAAGGSAGVAVATAEGTPVRVGVAPADALVSLLDGVELVCGPPELCAIPGRGSAVAVELAGDEPAVLEERGDGDNPVTGDTVDVEPGARDVVRAPAGGTSRVGCGRRPRPVTAPACDAGSDDDEPEDGLEEDESDDGSANATGGVFATAAPTPSANANAPARTMYCAFTGIALGGQPAWAPAERSPEPP